MTTRQDDEQEFVDFEEPLAEAIEAVIGRIGILAKGKPTGTAGVEAQALAVKHLAEALDILTDMLTEMQESDEEEEEEL